MEKKLTTFNLLNINSSISVVLRRHKKGLDIDGSLLKKSFWLFKNQYALIKIL